MILVQAGKETSAIHHDLSKPSGDVGRLGSWDDFSRNFCEAKTSPILLSDGLTSTVEDIKARMRETIAIGLPITSKGKTLNEMRRNLITLGKSLPSEARCYLVVDDSDDLLSGKLNAWFEHMIGSSVTKWVRTKTAHEAKSGVFPVYTVYNEIVKTAWRDGMEYFVLFGDDISVSCKEWLGCIKHEFAKLAKLASDRYGKDPDFWYGFGTVSFRDTTSPGFPTFPIVHKRHLEKRRKILSQFHEG